MIRILVSLGVVAAALGACTAGDEPAARPTPEVTAVASPVLPPECPNAARAVDLPPTGEAGGDVDGDGSDDRVWVAFDPGGDPGCEGFVVAETATGLVAASVGEPELSTDLGLPALAGLARLGEGGGAQIVVDLVAGASTQFAGVFTIHDGRLVRVRISGGAPEGRDLVPYGGSVGHIDGADCANGEVVLSAAAPTEDDYRVVRRFYRLDGDALVPTGDVERERVVPGELARFAEFGGAPFASCD